MTKCIPFDLDKYGNPTDGSELINCCYPNCGCDGNRLCMAENGPSSRAIKFNHEGMYDPQKSKHRIAAMENIFDEDEIND